MTRLAVTLLVRDEADVIAATLEHFFAQGADRIIVTDNGSTDATADILADYAAHGPLTVLQEPEHDYRQGPWVTRMARLAAELGSDWVINADADEFWICKDHTLRLADVLTQVPGDRGAVRASRVNLVGPAGDGPDWPDRLHWLDLHTLSERGTPLAAKACHRADPDVTVGYGSHDATGPLIGPVWEVEPLEILHVPVRSWPHYRRKISNGGTAYQQNREVDQNVGWHWRSDYQRLLAGGLRERYDAQSVTDEMALARPDQYRPGGFLRQHLLSLRDGAVLPARLGAVLPQVSRDAAPGAAGYRGP
jgi:hypothetical protein